MKIKRIAFLSAVLLCSVTVFNGCSKDDGGSGTSQVTSINAKVVNGTDYNFGNVKAVTYMGSSYVVAEGSYTNGGFKIDLPETVSSEYLELLTDDTDEEEVSDWMTVSDKTALMNSIYLEGYDESGDYIGDLFYGAGSVNSTSYSYTEGQYVYVNKDVKLTGSTTDTDNSSGITLQLKSSANVVLKAGWNIMYYIETVSFVNNTGTITYTTSKPSGLQWYSEDDFDSLVGFESALKPAQPENTLKFTAVMQKMLSKHRLFSKTK